MSASSLLPGQLSPFFFFLQTFVKCILHVRLWLAWGHKD
jgi:hypothetical protein